MKTKTRIYDEGLERYPKSSIIFGNFMMMLWITLGTAACWFLHPVAAWIYLTFAIVMICVVLRKFVCINCYYYNKWCCLGWGKLSALLFKKGNIKEFDKSIGLKLAPITYGVLTLAPLILIIISTIQNFTAYKIAVLLPLILISFYSVAISRKKSCVRCKMRLFCPGSVAK